MGADGLVARGDGSAGQPLVLDTPLSPLTSPEPLVTRWYA